MNYVDYIIIAVVAVGFILGFKDGLVRKIIGLIGLVIGIGLAFQFAEPFGKFLAPFLNDEIYLAEIMAGIIIFLSTLFLTTILKRVIHPLDRVNKFVNQFLGGLAGTLQIIFFLSAFFLFTNIFDFPKEEDKGESLLYFKVFQIVPSTIELVLGDASQAREFIDNYIRGEAPLPEIPEIDSSSINLDQFKEL